MGLINETASQYYTGVQGYFNATLTTSLTINLTFDPLPTAKSDIRVYVDNLEIDPSFYTYTSPTVSLSGYTINAGQNVEVRYVFAETGKYRFVSIEDIVNNFMIAYVGNGKMIDDVKRSDVLFHCKRGIQEFSYDIARVEKIQEIELGPTLTMAMPQDYVNYVKLSWIDDGGHENVILPYEHSSRPNVPILQGNDYSYLFDNEGNLLLGDSVQRDRFDSRDVSNIQDNAYFSSQVYEVERSAHMGGRYGLFAGTSGNTGIFMINEAEGNIAFSSDLSGKIITLKYISDGLGTDGEMKVHKFAEEAIYKHIAYNIVSTKLNAPEYIVNRYRKERRAAMRNAKLRLQNFKPLEFIQTMRGKSKHIKH
jgi:hypothetical protein